MAILEKITNPGKDTVGNIGDIWVNTLTNMTYKLASIITGSNNKTWYDWQLIDNTANSGGGGGGSSSDVILDVTTGKSYKMIVNNGKLYIAEV